MEKGQAATKLRGYLRTIGPGLLYAGAAIGVSHLVQSTRAGADFGFALIGFVIIANILKFPFFEYGPRYAVATGESMIEGYRRLGNWALALFVIMTLGTMFAIQAAVTIVTAGLASHLIGFGLGVVAWSAIILIICLAVLLIGQFPILDRLIKIVIVLLAVATLAAVFLAAKHGFVHDAKAVLIFNSWDAFPLAFIIALMGWMPAPLDIAVWHSVWTLERKKTSGHTPNLRESMFDFHMGYWGAAFLSLCFLSLGALVMFGSPEETPAKGPEFAASFVEMYTSSLGQWSHSIIGIAALTTMFSTTITVLDAYPRVLQRISIVTFPSLKEKGIGRSTYLIWIVLVAAGAVMLLGLLASSMTFMVDLATIISFLTAPVFAFINYRLINLSHVPKEQRPGSGLKWLSWVGIVFLAIFSVIYLYQMLIGF